MASTSGESSRTLGEHTFTINPGAIGKPKDDDKQLNGYLKTLKKVAKMMVPVMAVLFSPLLFSLALFLYAVMLFGGEVAKNTFLKFVFPGVLGSLAKAFRKERAELLQHCHGRVIDVGAGTGEYMRYFNSDKVTEVVAIEPVSSLHPFIKAAAVKANIQQLTIFDGFLDALLLQEGEASFDYVILGNVLCEVPSQRELLADVDKLLKPNGVVYFVEHVGRPQGTLLRHVQNMMNPWWRVVSGGCNCNRDTMDSLQATGWEIVSWNVDPPGGMPFVGPFVIGLARKCPKAS